MRALLLAAFLVSFVAPANAQERELPVTEVAAGSVRDQPIGGAAEEVLTTTFISLQPTREWRAYREIQLADATGTRVTRATLSGRISVNNGVDRGVRTIELGLYSADGVITLEDFANSPRAVGEAAYAPPGDSSVDFSFDVADAAQALLEGGATHIGVRARSVTNDAPNVLSEATLAIFVEPISDAGSDAGTDASTDAGVDAGVDSG
ncbi:MAG: hypothetical protein AAGE52_35320, partial [Myxococcota bacterium]